MRTRTTMSEVLNVDLRTFTLINVCVKLESPFYMAGTVK